jgi:hypothetical protein
MQGKTCTKHRTIFPLSHCIYSNATINRCRLYPSYLHSLTYLVSYLSSYFTGVSIPLLQASYLPMSSLQNERLNQQFLSEVCDRSDLLDGLGRLIPLPLRMRIRRRARPDDFHNFDCEWGHGEFGLGSSPTSIRSPPDPWLLHPLWKTSHRSTWFLFL